MQRRAFNPSGRPDLRPSVAASTLRGKADLPRRRRDAEKTTDPVFGFALWASLRLCVSAVKPQGVPSKTAPPANNGGRRQANSIQWRRRSDAGHIRRVEPFLAGPDLEFDFLTLGERFETVHRDRGEVHKDVLAAVLFDEAIALGVIEPLHLP